MGRYSFLANALKVFDIVTMVSWFTISAVMTSAEINEVSLGEFLAIRISIGNIVLFIAFVAFWHALFSAFRLYRPSRLSNWYSEAFDLVKATSVGTFVWIILAALLDISIVNVRFLLLFWFGASTFALIGRLVARTMIKRFSKSERNLRRLLIVGANPRSTRFARQITANPELGYRLIGFVDDASVHASILPETECNLVASVEDLPDYLRKTAVDEVLVCLPLKSRYDDVAEIVGLCEEQGITVRILADLFQYKLTHSRVDQVGDQPFITVHPHGINGVQASAKRILDVLLSVALLALLFPVFIAATILIKTSSRGPIFFSQERLGINKKHFRILKFRTMVREAEQQQAELEQFNEAAGPVFKIKHDPRITSVGTLLRRTSVDELPQLFNVIKGEMSLVGPRPLPVRDYEGFSKDWQRRRFSVRPGITGLWQVNGRSSVPFERWMELDLQYIDEWSLLLDLKVMLKTVPAVLRGSGAE